MSLKDRFHFNLRQRPPSDLIAFWGDFLSAPTDAGQAIKILKNGCAGVVVEYDFERDLIRVYRDSLGIEPVFYSIELDTLSVSRLQFVSKKPKVNEKFFLQVLSDDYSDQRSTADENVRRLLPGHFLEWDGKRAIERQWYFPRVTERNDQPEELRYELRHLYQINTLEIVRSQKCGIFWSGGLDSNILALNAKEFRVPLFTIQGSWEGATVAAGSYEFMRSLRVDHYKFEMSEQFESMTYQPEAEPFVRFWPGLGVYRPLFSEAQAQGITTILTGHGPDDLFSFSPPNFAFKLLPFSLYKNLRRFKTAPKLPPGYRQEIFDEVVRAKWKRINQKEVERFSWIKRQLITRFMHGGAQQLLSEGFNILGDRWNMKVRHPLLQQNTFEFALSLPEKYFPFTARGKEFVRQTYVEFAPQQLTVQDFTEAFLVMCEYEFEQLKERLVNSRINDFDWVDVPKFLSSTQPNKSYEDLGHLYSILYCDQMLKQLG